MSDVGAGSLVVEPGQVWRYRTRPGEEESLLRVLVVGDVPGLVAAVHVLIDGIRVINPVDPTSPNTTLRHVPISASALRASLTELVGFDDTEPDLEVHRQWREANGGVFALSLADTVQAVDDALRGHARPAAG